MKTTSLSTKLIVAMLLGAVLLYFGIEGYQYLVNPTATTLVYSYSAEETIGLKGFVVRDETVVACNETMLELTHAEGERVASGKPLATIYHSEEALASAGELETLNAQLEQLNYAKSVKNNTEATLKLDDDIRDDIVALRVALESNDYGTLDNVSEELKTTVLKRELAYGSDTDLDALIAELEAKISQVSASIKGGTSTIYAPFAGTYSAVTDGYEGVLTPEALNEMTPSMLNTLQPVEENSTVGKIIEGTTWYFVSTVTESDAKRLTTGKSYCLRMASGVDFDLEVTVSKIGKAENGKCLLVLYSDRNLSAVTLLREQNAEMIVKSHTGLRIPKNALRIGESGQSGVYCLVGLTAYFKPVNILYQGSDYCLVEPGEIEAATEGQLSLYTLRANDEVIISSVELFNGKVIE